VVSSYEKKLAYIKIPLEDLLNKLTSSKKAKNRAEYLKVLHSGLEEKLIDVAALSLSTVAGAWYIENKERSYETVRSKRNLSNNCPDEVAKSLLQAVKSKGVALCKRYYAMKKKILQETQGLKAFSWSDRNAPIDIQDDGKEEQISWQEAVRRVDHGYRKFSRKMADLFKEFVDEERIDFPSAENKKGGAFCSGAVPAIGPFIFVNFQGSKVSC
jgi:oligoendopeptidase F